MSLGSRALAVSPDSLGPPWLTSQGGLEAGVQGAVPLWRLDVVGRLLELQQHGHLDSRGRQRAGTRSVTAKDKLKHSYLLADYSSVYFTFKLLFFIENYE